MADGESNLVERKESVSDGNKIGMSICAFANDLPGLNRPGVIFVGIRDDGTCAELLIDDDLQLRLANIRSDGNLQPLPSLTVEKLTISGCTVAVMQVQPVLYPPMRFRGRVYVRVGPSVRLATPDEERRLAERGQAAHLPFDLRPAPTSALDDLDLDYVRTSYLVSAVARDVLEQNQRSLEQQLRSLRLTSAGQATWGALLGLGIHPQAWCPGAYVQFLRIDGTQITDPILRRKEFTGRIDDVLRLLEETLSVNISVATEIVGHDRELLRPNYPFAALQQYVRNAIMHRDYQGSNAPVRVHWYSDRIQISNPGSLYGTVNSDNFGTGDTDYRNPLVAEIMHHLGLAQRFGLGLPLARKALADNGNPEPEFTFTTNRVEVILRSAE